MTFKQLQDCPEKENFSMEQMGNLLNTKRSLQVNADNRKSTDEAVGKRKKMTKEERMLFMEEKKKKKEVSRVLRVPVSSQYLGDWSESVIQEEKLRKAALKAEAAESKKLQKEMQKWAKGKFAQDSIVTEIDAKVVELGSVGGWFFFISSFLFWWFITDANLLSFTFPIWLWDKFSALSYRPSTYKVCRKKI